VNTASTLLLLLVIVTGVFVASVVGYFVYLLLLKWHLGRCRQSGIDVSVLGAYKGIVADSVNTTNFLVKKKYLEIEDERLQKVASMCHFLLRFGLTTFVLCVILLFSVGSYT
jgi:hypothetical protein